MPAGIREGAVICRDLDSTLGTVFAYYTPCNSARSIVCKYCTSCQVFQCRGSRFHPVGWFHSFFLEASACCIWDSELSSHRRISSKIELESDGGGRGVGTLGTLFSDSNTSWHNWHCPENVLREIWILAFSAATSTTRVRPSTIPLILILLVILEDLSNFKDTLSRLESTEVCKALYLTQQLAYSEVFLENNVERFYDG